MVLDAALWVRSRSSLWYAWGSSAPPSELAKLKSCARCWHLERLRGSGYDSFITAKIPQIFLAKLPGYLHGALACLNIKYSYIATGDCRGLARLRLTARTKGRGGSVLLVSQPEPSG